MDGDLDIEATVNDIGDSLFGESNLAGEGDKGELSSTPTPAPMATPSPAPEPSETPEDKTGEQKPASTALAQPTPTGLTVPKTWRAEAAATWAQIPPAAQAEIAKREQEIFDGIEGLKPDANIGKAVKQVMQPYEHIMAQYGINPINQISSLMQSHYTLAFGTQEQKVELIQRIVKDYGIDISAGKGSEESSEDGYVDPQVKALRNELIAVQSKLQSYDAQRNNEIVERLQAQVVEFAQRSDVPYLKEVHPIMADLLSKGTAKDLMDAYTKACKLHPTISEKLIEERLKEKAEAEKRAAQERAEAARKTTSVRVRTEAKPGSAAASLGSMDDTLQETFANIQNRGKS